MCGALKTMKIVFLKDFDRQLSMFYSNPRAYARVMRGAIAVNGSFFNAHRRVSEYLAKAWFRDTSPDAVSSAVRRASAASICEVG